MADPPQPAPARRRSSVAYDPARDTFKEIPDTIPEDVVADPTSSKTNSPVQISKNHPTMISPQQPQKRSRSPSPSRRPVLEVDQAAGPPLKKQRSSEHDSMSNGVATPTNGNHPSNPLSKMPRIPKAVREDGEVRSKPAWRSAPPNSRRPDQRQDTRRNQDGERPRDRDRRPPRRSRSPENRMPAAYRRRSPPRAARRDPSRSTSPIRDSPPRDLPRPGGGRGRGRNVLAEQERLRAERERQQSFASVSRGVQASVTQHYNAVPEYVKIHGREWRRNDSQIKGLRTFNNWVKSCIIQKFSPQEKQTVQEEELGWGEAPKEPEEIKPLLVLDIGCGKGGDLGKWEKAPQPVGLYVGLDPADQSIDQARDRYKTMWKGRRPRFDARFDVKDCFGEWIGDVPIVHDVGIDPTPNTMNRWGKGGGFDVITMMFTMHYSFESKEKVEMMLRNVSGALKKGGRMIGVCPNSDVLSDRVKDWFAKNHGKYKSISAISNGSTTPQPDQTHTNGTIHSETSAPKWGNSIYNVRFPPSSAELPPLADDGSFRPPFGHKYTYFITEAVDVPEFVVPWEAFRAIAENYGLEQRYRKGFLDIWNCETDPNRATNTGGAASTANGGGWGQEPVDDGKDSTAAVARELEQLGVRMGVIKHLGGQLCMTEEEKEAVSFYHGFCFVKT